APPALGGHFAQPDDRLLLVGLVGEGLDPRATLGAVAHGAGEAHHATDVRQRRPLHGLGGRQHVLRERDPVVGRGLRRWHGDQSRRAERQAKKGRRQGPGGEGNRRKPVGRLLSWSRTTRSNSNRTAPPTTVSASGSTRRSSVRSFRRSQGPPDRGAAGGPGGGSGH